MGYSWIGEDWDTPEPQRRPAVAKVVAVRRQPTWVISLAIHLLFIAVLALLAT